MSLNLCELLCFLKIEYLLQCAHLKHSLGNTELDYCCYCDCIQVVQDQLGANLFPESEGDQAPCPEDGTAGSMQGESNSSH